MKKKLLCSVLVLLIVGQQCKAIITKSTRNSYWQGATVGYNLAGAQIDNIIGSTKIAINTFKGENPLLDGNWAIVGNFGNFIAARKKEEISDNIIKITQQSQGLNVGFGSVWEFQGGDLKAELADDKPVFRIEFISGYRLNGFQGVDGETTDLALNQFRNSLCLEYEIGKWGNGGHLSFSVEGALTAFDKSVYQKLFGEKRSIMPSAEACVIVPFSDNMGLMANLSVASKAAPVYQFGIILRPKDAD